MAAQSPVGGPITALLGKIRDPAVVGICVVLMVQIDRVQGVLDRASERLAALELYRAGAGVESEHVRAALEDLRRRMELLERKR